MKMKPVLQIGLAAVLGATAFTASAKDIRALNLDDPSFGTYRSYSKDAHKRYQGDLTNIRSEFDQNRENFWWEYTVTGESDGFWLVTSPGPNPKNHKREYAILFGDITNDTLWAYEYSGENGPNSYATPGNLLGRWDGEIKSTTNANGEQTVRFYISVADVNNDDALSGLKSWDGVGYGKKAGLWFHIAQGSTFETDADGNLTSFSYERQGWHDTKGNRTKVPEPTMLSLLGFGLMGAGFMAHRRRKAMQTEA